MNMIIINNKEIRNTVEQVHKNKDDIKELQETERDVYTKTEADTKFQDKLTTSDTISIYANNEISVDPDFVVTKNSNGNVNGTLQVAHLQSENWDEDDDCKADVTLGSGLRASSINLETSGEESGSRIFLRGSSAVDSEGYIDAYGQTRIYTKNRIKVYNNDVTPATEETVAYVSDITGSGSINNFIIHIPAEPGAGGHPTIDDLVDVETEITASQYNGIVAAVEAGAANGNYPSIILWLGETGLFRNDYVFKPNKIVLNADNAFNTDTRWDCIQLHYAGGTFAGVYSLRVAPISGKYYVRLFKETVTTA